MRLPWRERGQPRPVAAMLAMGASKEALRSRLLLDSRPERWRGVAGEDWIALIGPELPWVEGAEWFGAEEAAPALLLPTLYDPGLHPALVQQAVLGRKGEESGPFLLSPLHGIFPLGAALPLCRERL
ncbi:MAG TPA: hypothetical protein PKY30_09210 [Myxococcota bacterium]|nr:hypothetical protein [Myxococcota bacterium]HND30560.1 hypothetical protein [Myxococcota bacterium]HNH47205.1 hypothetical protein [Myxococcota bacterium]